MEVTFAYFNYWELQLGLSHSEEHKPVSQVMACG